MSAQNDIPDIFHQPLDDYSSYDSIPQTSSVEFLTNPNHNSTHASSSNSTSLLLPVLRRSIKPVYLQDYIYNLLYFNSLPEKHKALLTQTSSIK